MPFLALLLILSYTPLSASCGFKIFEDDTSFSLRGCVNILSQTVSIHENDLQVVGPGDDLFLGRHYSSTNANHDSLLYAWAFDFVAYHEHQRNHINIKEHGGFPIRYEKGRIKLNLGGFSGPNAGWSNTRQGLLAARANPFNNFLTHSPPGEPGDWKLINADGSARFIKRIHLQHWIEETERHNASGQKLLLNDTGKERTVTLYDSAKKTALKSLHIKRHDLHYITADSSDGKSAWYRLRGTSDHRHQILESFKAHGKPLTKVEYESIPLPGSPNYMVTKISQANERFIALEYGPMRSWDQGGGHLGKVQCIKEPIGTTSTPLVSYKIVDNQWPYQDHNKSDISVFDAMGYERQFLIEDGRLNQLRYYDLSHKTLKIIDQKWTTVNGQAGFLHKKYISDGNKGLLCLREFNYDRLGNVTNQKTYGHIQSSLKPFGDTHHPQFNSTDCYNEDFTFTQDKFNLPLTHKKPNGIETHYEYMPNTNLPAAQYELCKGKVYSRKFFRYNDLGLLVETIEDNGQSKALDNSCTWRLINKLSLVKSGPALGLPEKEELFSYSPQEGTQLLLSKTNTYGIYNKICAQTVYDPISGNEYTLRYEYDEEGRLTAECDALGIWTRYEYDENNNKIYQEGPLPGAQTYYTYDYSNRLIKSIEKHPDSTLTKYYAYDLKHNLIAETDPFGAVTNYEYNAFGKITKKILPEYINAAYQKVRPTISYEYDTFGNITKEIHNSSFEKHAEYNLLGKPTYQKHEDGREQWMRYDLEGNLLESRNQDGLRECYEYTPQGQVLKASTYDHNQEIRSTHYKYKNNQLVQVIAPNGNHTYYQYNGAGKIIEEHTVCSTGETHLKRLKYNGLGQVLETWEGDPNVEMLGIINTYDNKGQLIRIEKKTQAGQLIEKVEYAYNELGKKVLETRFPNNQPSTILTIYDSKQRPIKEVDPEGNATVFRYNERALNEYGQTVLEKTTFDPMGIVVVERLDPLMRPDLCQKFNPLGEQIEEVQIFYHLNGKPEQRRESNFREGKCTQTITTAFRFNKAAEVIELIEAANTPLETHTQWHYRNGKLSHKVSPNGAELFYTYDNLGRLTACQSNDQSVDYEYHYDRYNQLIASLDHVNGEHFYRSYDLLGRCIKEELNDLHLSSTYDSLGRKTSLTLPDNSSVDYDYKKGRLYEVSRIKDKQTQYSHKYLEYDLQGHVLHSQLANGESIHYDIDIMGRISNIKHSKYEFTVPPDGYNAKGLLTCYSYKDPIGKQECYYSYDDHYNLNAEQGFFNHNYAYDSRRNRVQKDEHAYDVNELNHVNFDGHHHYHYDPAGNLLSRSPTSEEDSSLECSWDALNRLSSVLVNNQLLAKYTYDSEGRRRSKHLYSLEDGQKVHLSSLRYLYDNSLDIGSVNPQNEIVEFRALGIGIGAEIGAAISIELDQDTLVPIHNHRGDVIILTGLYNRVHEAARYSSFGNCQHYESGWVSYSPTSQSPKSNPWQFQSKRYDDETGWTYFGKRYYSPELGRWINPDPQGDTDGPNRYAYVLNNPLSRNDLYGLSMWDSFCSFFDIGNSFENKAESSPSESFQSSQNTSDYKLPYLFNFDANTDILKKQSDNATGHMYFYQGINNSFEETDKTCGDLRSSLNLNITGCHKRSSGNVIGDAILAAASEDLLGKPLDIIQVLSFFASPPIHKAISMGITALKFESYLANEKAIQASVQNHITDYNNTNGAPQLVSAYSYGGVNFNEISKRLPDEVCKTIHVCCTGTPVFLDSSRLASVHYYHDRRDPVSFTASLLHPFDLAAAEAAGQVSWKDNDSNFKLSELSIDAHYFMGKHYQDGLKDFISGQPSSKQGVP